MGTKLIVDGNNIANRTFFAYKRLSAEVDGQIVGTGVIYGFTKYIVDLAIRYQAKDITVVWDSGSSYRKRIYPEYKAGRDHSHYPDMILQMEDLNLLLSVMNVSQIRADGHEADDLIYTIVDEDRSNNIKIIFSSDKDLLMFIRNDVMIHQPNGNNIIDINNVHEVYGVPVEHLRDFFALMGDKVDNISGVPGIGKKTAKIIINQCGCIENALQVDTIDGVQASKIRALKENKELLSLSVKLVSPIKIDQKEIINNEAIFDIDMIQDILDKYKIKTIRMSSFVELMEANNG